MGLSVLAVVVKYKIDFTDSTEHIGERKDDTALSCYRSFFVVIVSERVKCKCIV